jgi:hypothetical protein
MHVTIQNAAIMRVCAGFIQSPHTLATEALDILIRPARGKEPTRKSKKKYQPRRWVVERAYSWLSKLSAIAHGNRVSDLSFNKTAFANAQVAYAAYAPRTAPPAELLRFY